MNTTNTSLSELIKRVASCALRDADISAQNLEAHARRLCAEHDIVGADLDVVISGARASGSEREKLLDKARQYPSTHIHTERRRRGARP